MARQIKFRGRWKGSNVWVYGDLICSSDKERIAIVTADDHTCEVEFNSVGQFSGLLDCNGKEIYEGDIVVYRGQCKDVVEFKHGMFGYTLADGWFVGYGGNTNFSFNPLDKSKEHEVIGNVFDNPSLLK